MAFTPAEVDYLTSQPLARLATVAPGGQPDVVPVAFEFDGDSFWVGGNGESVLSTRKVRNVVDGNRQVALVIDDMVSFDPFIARCPARGAIHQGATGESSRDGPPPGTRPGRSASTGG